MKQLIILFFVCIYTSISAQCPTGSVTLNKQADVDQFLLDYPSCTDIDGYLTINGSNTTDISGLSGIETIDGNFVISGTSATTASFPNLSSVNG